MRGRVRLASACLAVALIAAGCGTTKRFFYTGFGRDAWQQPEKVVAALEIGRGDVVADLGAGGGYFTFRLADAVGPDGRVYAIDVDPDMTGYLRAEAGSRGAAHVRVIDALPDDPKIPEGGVDLVLLTNTYHHIGDRVAYFGRLRDHLRPGGRVAVVEGSGNGFPAGHATDAEEIRAEMTEAGYRLHAAHDFLEKQSFQVFVARR